MTAPSPLSSPARRLNVSALTEPIDPAALDAFVADSKATGKPWRQVTTGLPRPGVGDVISQLLPAVIPLAGLLALLVMGGPSLIDAIWRFTLEAPFPLNLVIVGFVAVLLITVAAGFYRVVATIRAMMVPRWWWEAAYRLTRLAAGNGLHYGHDEDVSHPGLIFSTGINRVAERRLVTTAGRRVEIGNYRYTIPAEDRKNWRVYGWGYVAVTLDRRLPHLLLDAKANNRSVFGIRTSNLPADLAADQRLSLGGEFDEKFTLYAPSDYGRDAFQIFTPDLMALFIDRLGTFDVEIVDDTLFVYGSRFDLLDPRTYDWLQELVDTVVARTLRRSERYRDDFALLESDPATRSPSSQPSAAALTAEDPNGTGNDQPFALLPGFVLGAGTAPISATHDPGRPSGPEHQVFTFGGDGPPRSATNTIAARGRRLRTRRWTFASVMGLLLIVFYIYNEFVGPLLGLPTLEN